MLTQATETPLYVNYNFIINNLLEKINRCLSYSNALYISQNYFTK